MLCYFMVWYGMVWNEMKWYVMLCKWCNVMLCYVMLWNEMKWNEMIWYDMIWYVMLCYVMLCYVMLCYVMLPQQVLTYIHVVVYTYSKIKSHKKSYKIFDFKSRDSTFYKAIEKRWDVSSMQLIFMTKQRKQILPPKTERYEAKINK